MCYVSGEVGVGVRELRQNLSKYLRRVAEGESFRVSDRGRPVAVLSPLPEHVTAWERLKAQGRILPARLELSQLPVPKSFPIDLSISDALLEQRSEE